MVLQRGIQARPEQGNDLYERLLGLRFFSRLAFWPGRSSSLLAQRTGWAPLLRAIHFAESGPRREHIWPGKTSKTREARKRELEGHPVRRPKAPNIEGREASKRYVLAEILPPLPRRFLSGPRSVWLLSAVSAVRTRDSAGSPARRCREAISRSLGRSSDDRRRCPVAR